MRYYFESQQEGRFNMLDYYKGMDISFLQEYMEKGMKTYDLDGTPTDPLELAKKHGVSKLPTLLYFKDGKKVGETIGVLTPQELLQASEQNFK